MMNTTPQATSRPGWGGILLVGLLVSGAILAPRLFESATPPPGPAQVIDRELVAALERRLAELEERVATPTLTAPGPSADGDGRREVVAERDDLVRQLADLSRRVARLEQTASGAAPPARPEPQLQLSATDLARAAELRAVSHRVIFDPAASERDRVRAWGKLRGLGENAWNEGIVLEMARIGLTSADPKVRANVWRQADADARSPAIVPPLLQALAQDTVADVREEAAETLENYTDDPAVLEALRFAAQNDADEKVRHFAQRSLERAKRR